VEREERTGRNGEEGGREITEEMNGGEGVGKKGRGQEEGGKGEVLSVTVTHSHSCPSLPTLVLFPIELSQVPMSGKESLDNPWDSHSLELSQGPVCAGSPWDIPRTPTSWCCPRVLSVPQSHQESLG